MREPPARAGLSPLALIRLRIVERFAVGLLTRLHRGRKALLLALNRLLAPVESIGRRFAQIVAAALHVVGAFIGFVSQKLARLRTGLGREQNPRRHTQAQSEEK